MAKILVKFTPEPEVAFFSRNAPVATTAASTTRTISYRKNIRDLTSDELNALREAFTKLYNLSSGDDRSYQYIAGIHGFPSPVYCAHGNPLFAVWHRPYILILEKSLQEQVPGVTLPYWDWTSQISQQEGMPTAYTDPAPNPLLKARIEFQDRETFRQPGAPSSLRTLALQVQRAQQENRTYTRYSAALETPHNGLHVWVGGTMGQVPYAAYDPIFWAHHCNVDRLFAEWQAQHPNIIPTNEFYEGRSIWETSLAPFGVSTQDIWDIRALGYEYLTAETSVEAAAKFAAAPAARFSLAAVEPNFEKAELEFQNLLHPKDSFEVRVFLNQPDADANTPTEGNDHYADSLFFFGHGECPGEAGHCDPRRGRIDQFDVRRPSHVTPFTTYADVTEAMRKVAGAGEVTVKLVAVDAKGNAVANPGTDFDAIALVTS